VTVNLLQFEQLSEAFVDSVSLPLPLAQAWHGSGYAAAMAWSKDDTGVGLMDTREIVRIVASNTATIDLRSYWRRTL